MKKTQEIPLERVGSDSQSGGTGYRETIKVENPDGTYSYKYKDHNGIIVIPGNEPRI